MIYYLLIAILIACKYSSIGKISMIMALEGGRVFISRVSTEVIT